MKQTKIYHSAITMLSLIAVMFIAIVGFDSSPHVPLVIGCIVAGIVAKSIGYSWEEILESMIDGITNSLEAVIILLCIGMMMGTWIACGTVPAMIYYGLRVINARMFLVMTFLFCGVISMAAGSWGTAGTVGLAFAAIGKAMGIPPAMTAGAIISGAYIGELASPISDAANLAAAVSRSDVVAAVRHMLPMALIGCAIAGAAYTLLGINYGGDAAVIEASVSPILETIRTNFRINPLCFLPLLIVVGCILCKVPSIVSIMAGMFSGGALAVAMQGQPVGDVISACYSGFVSDSGNELIDSLLTAGGIEAMMYTISIIIVAMAFGGLMQGTGQMQALIAPLVKRIRSAAALTGVTILSCVFCNVVLPDQYLGISVPGQLYREEFEKRGVENKTLCNILGAGGAVTSPLVPWNTCGAYMSSLLAASTVHYLPYAFFSLVMPFVMLLYMWVAGRRSRRKTGKI